MYASVIDLRIPLLLTSSRYQAGKTPAVEILHMNATIANPSASAQFRACPLVLLVLKLTTKK